MPSLKIQLPPPPIARPRSALGQYHREPWLTHWPSGAPMSTLGEYEPAPWLQRYNNGVPMTAAPDGAGTVPKAHLVRMALEIALSKKCGCGMRGLGDDGGDPYSIDVGGTDNVYPEVYPVSTTTPPVIITGPAPEDVGISAPSSIPLQQAPINVPAETTTGGYTYNPSTGVLTPTGTATNSNTLSNFVNGLLGSLTSPLGSRGGYTLNPATGQYVYTPGSGVASLASPIAPGSSLTWGAVLGIGAVVLVGAYVIGGSKVQRKK